MNHQPAQIKIGFLGPKTKKNGKTSYFVALDAVKMKLHHSAHMLGWVHIHAQFGTLQNIGMIALHHRTQNLEYNTVTEEKLKQNITFVSGNSLLLVIQYLYQSDNSVHVGNKIMYSKQATATYI